MSTPNVDIAIGMIAHNRRKPRRDNENEGKPVYLARHERTRRGVFGVPDGSVELKEGVTGPCLTRKCYYLRLLRFRRSCSPLVNVVSLGGGLLFVKTDDKKGTSKIKREKKEKEGEGEERLCTTETEQGYLRI